MMASLGHVAVGMLIGRWHGGRGGSPPSHRPWDALVIFGSLAALPDLDVVPVALGVSDLGSLGHRGVSHSFALALIVGGVMAALARRWRWPALRTFLFATAAVASHAVLDELGGGRGLVLFWPFSLARHATSWHPLTEAPRGLELFCEDGALNVLRETLLFSPLAVWALLPPRRRRPQRLASSPSAEAADELAAADDAVPPARSAG